MFLNLQAFALAGQDMSVFYERVAYCYIVTPGPAVIRNVCLRTFFNRDAMALLRESYTLV